MAAKHLGDKTHREGGNLFHFEIFEESGLIILEIHTRLPTFEASPVDESTVLIKVGEIEGATKEECLKKAFSWCHDWAKSRNKKA